MDYKDFSGETISEQDKPFAQEFANFVNGRMCSANQTGKELTKAHRYLMRQLALNYQIGCYDERNKWASRLAAMAYDRLTEDNLIYDPEYTNFKMQ